MNALETNNYDLTSSSGTLSPLTPKLNRGLIPVTLFGILSFFTATGLFLLLSYRIIMWHRKSRHINQFVVLIWNLLFADIQQSMAFLLNAKWLVEDRIHVGTTTCWAQGWFVSTGDLASGIWSFAIGLHTFAAIIFGYRLSNTKFMIAVLLIWGFVYAMAVTGIAMHSADIYVRAVAWCWVNIKYGKIRLWLHYFWIFSFEFGTVLVYSVLILALRWRIQGNFYRSQQQIRHAKEAAKLMIAYPAIYVVCTLPLATLRMYQEATQEQVSETWFCFAGAMITSNGWMDVILYCLTRRIMLFSDEPPTSDNGIESFGTPWVKRDGFGTETTCEHVPPSQLPFGWMRKHWSQESDMIYMVDKPHRRQQPTNDLAGHVTIATERIVEVTSTPMTGAQRREAESGVTSARKTTEPWSTDSGSSSKSEEVTRSISPASMEYEIDSLKFKTKPAGF